ncbi:hypothetical protein LCGC14_1679530 [marine sediment metagenome]|uniref:Uncharacterized protein n=1 Tax=marine sediment metagenome TaxID=412755 RepID=A0A0F9HP55_9ZZZZ
MSMRIIRYGRPVLIGFFISLMFYNISDLGKSIFIGILFWCVLETASRLNDHLGL